MLSAWLLQLRTLPRDVRDTLFLLLVMAWVLLPQAARLPLWCSLGAGALLLWRGDLALKAKPLPGRTWLVLLLALTLAATYATHSRLLGLLTALVNAHLPVGKPPLAQSARMAGQMALLGTPVMLVLFVLFPRIGPLWGLPSDALTGRSGLSERMHVGAMAELALDDSVALRIKFDGAAPPQSEMYLRGPVLSSFDGLEWRALRPSLPARHALAADLQVAGEPLGYEVTLEPTRRPWLFVLEAAAERPELPGYRVTMQPDLQWTTSRPLNELVRYHATSHTAFRHGPAQPELGLQEYVDLPAGFNPRTLALAAEIRRDARYAQADAATLVRAALERLRSGGYRYTLEPGVYGRDSADEFWFDRKEGFCEHISSAFVVLMRALDVPARIVTGYQGGERNSVDDFWTVRQSDAHAWAEVWQAGRGWVRVDPTAAVAPGRIGASQRLSVPRGAMAQALGEFSPTLSAQLRAAWEAVNNGWNQWVLNYTQGKQLGLLKNLGFKTPSWQDLSYLFMGVLVLTSLAGGAWTLWERSQHDPWLRLLHKARRRLAQAGIASTPASSPRQLARQVLATYGARGQALHDWLLALEAQRYAGAPAASQSARHTSQRRQLAALRQQWRRLAWPA